MGGVVGMGCKAYIDAGIMADICCLSYAEVPCTEGSQRARFAAVLGIVGFLDIPIIHFSVLWWRTIHPKPKVLSMESPGSGLEPVMLITLLISFLAFTLIFFLLLGQRIYLEKMRDEIHEIKRKGFIISS